MFLGNLMIKGRKGLFPLRWSMTTEQLLLFVDEILGDLFVLLSPVSDESD
jgi:hypothetical protein